MALENIVEKLFADNPDLSRDGAVKRLKEMRDPQTNKSMWKAATIRDRVKRYLRKKEEGHHAVHVESPVGIKESGSDLKIEGKEITRHKPKGPFAIKSEGYKEEALDEIETDIKLNRGKVSFQKNLILIFSIASIVWAILFILCVIQLKTFESLIVAVVLTVFVCMLCWILRLFSVRLEKAVIFKKAKWIVSYWFDSKGNFDNSFFKYNYPSGIEKEAVEYASKLIKKNIKEHAWDGNK